MGGFGLKMEERSRAEIGVSKWQVRSMEWNGVEWQWNFHMNNREFHYHLHFHAIRFPFKGINITVCHTLSIKFIYRIYSITFNFNSAVECS